MSDELRGRSIAIDGNLISIRNPDDLPAFCEAIVREFSSVHAA